MTIIVADIHFGRLEQHAEREKEAALVACLRSLSAGMKRLILLGDVFDYYIEYRHLIPRGYSRFMGLLAELTDAGTELVYIVGNHDPWHLDYFSEEFGARVYSDEMIDEDNGARTYFHHGDGIARKSATYNRLRRILRHPIPVSLYRHVLPGDLGVRLARYVSRNYGDEGVDENVADDLRAEAQRLLDGGFGRVVMGHSHLPEVTSMRGGVYMNPGSWQEFRTVLRLSDDEGSLLTWNGRACEAYQPATS